VHACSVLRADHVNHKEPPRDDALGIARRSDKGDKMIELVLSVCLVSNPQSCREEGLIYSAENLAPMQCIVRAQPQMAKWVGEHPGWTVTRWTCRPAGKYTKT
jgi:hypothetical protein